MNTSFEQRVAFAIGTGRCGTHFLNQVLDQEPTVASSHERNPLNETFHRYCKWYRLPVDHEGFLHAKEIEIARDLEKHAFSFEASAYLSLSIPELYQRFGARFLLLIRSPEQVVRSYLRKGLYDGEPWYGEPFVKMDLAQALGYQPCRFFHHFLGRIAPTGAAFERWNRMTRVGKLAWYWNTLNAKVLEQFAALPRDQWQVQKLEELSYEQYGEVARFLGFQSQVESQVYARIAAARPGSLHVGAAKPWTPQEKCEFEREVAPMAKQLGYEHRLSQFTASAPTQPTRRGLRLIANDALERLRVRTIEFLGGQA